MFARASSKKQEMNAYRPLPPQTTYRNREFDAVVSQGVAVPQPDSRVRVKFLNLSATLSPLDKIFFGLGRIERKDTMPNPKRGNPSIQPKLFARRERPCMMRTLVLVLTLAVFTTRTHAAESTNRLLFPVTGFSIKPLETTH